MKKAALILLCFGIFLWGVYYKLQGDRPNDKYIGTVSLLQGKSQTALDGYAVLRQYEDQAQLYATPKLADLKDDLPIVTQAAQALTTTATTTTAALQTTADTASAVSGTATLPASTVISVASNELGVRYSGEQLLPTVYTVYDAQLAMVTSPQKELRVPISPGVYYVQMDVTWGRSKNFVGAQYFFRVDVQ